MCTNVEGIVKWYMVYCKKTRWSTFTLRRSCLCPVRVNWIYINLLIILKCLSPIPSLPPNVLPVPNLHFDMYLDICVPENVGVWHMYRIVCGAWRFTWGVRVPWSVLWSVYEARDPWKFYFCILLHLTGGGFRRVALNFIRWKLTEMWISPYTA